MGRIEGQLPRDIVVIELVRQLESILPPELVGGVLQHAEWFAETADYGTLDGRANRAGELSVPESSSILSDKNAARLIRAELERRRFGASEIEAKLDMFERADDDVELEIDDGFIIKKHIDLSGVSFERTYLEPLAPRAIALGIAFTFIALTVEARIYDAEFDEAREALLAAIDRDMTKADAWPVELLRASARPEATHGLALLRGDEGALVRIFFFRELVWDVRFPNVQVTEEPFYSIDLSTSDETIS
jgi:hypothetical protein